MNSLRKVFEYLRGFVVNSPLLYFLFRQGSGKVKRFRVTKETELVIEGFPRSANTYALHTFLHIQSPRRPKVAHHIHTVAHVKAALKLNKPVLLLVRDPKGSVASLKMRRRNVPVDILLMRYVIFHRGLERYLENVIVARFDRFIESPDMYISKINEKFMTEFSSYKLDNEDREAIGESILKVNQKLGSNRPETQSIPSKEKALERERISRILRDQCPDLLEKANKLYSKIVKFDRFRS